MVDERLIRISPTGCYLVGAGQYHWTNASDHSGATESGVGDCHLLGAGELELVARLFVGRKKRHGDH